MGPKIRFKGVSTEWSTRQFTDIAQRVSISNVSGVLPGVEFEDIVSGEGHLNKDVKKKGCVKSGKEFVEGDVLFGKLRPYLKNILLADFKGVAIGDFWVLRPNDTDPYILYALVGSNKFMDIANISTGSKMPRADWSLVSNQSFYLPSLPEQQAIAGWFQALDGLIVASEKKIASLKQIKAASLQAMFPQEGETTPKVRFKGFEGEWEKQVIGNIGSAYSGLSGKTKEDFGVGDAKYITFLNVLTNAQIDTDILEAVNVCEGERQNKVKQGDLLFNTSSETPDEVGMCSVMNEDLDNVYLNSFCFGFRLTDTNTSPLFIAYLLRSHIGRRLMSILAQGATRYNLSKTSFCKAEILLPSKKEEQQKIADFFTNLDTQISLQTQRLEKLKQIKAACLDNMFV